LRKDLRDAESLKAYATAMRYPGEYRKLKKTDAVTSVKLAEKVKVTIKNKLLESGFNLK
jgi:hypothetical protein